MPPQLKPFLACTGPLLLAIAIILGIANYAPETLAGVSGALKGLGIIVFGLSGTIFGWNFAISRPIDALYRTRQSLEVLAKRADSAEGPVEEIALSDLARQMRETGEAVAERVATENQVNIALLRREGELYAMLKSLREKHDALLRGEFSDGELAGRFDGLTQELEAARFRAEQADLRRTELLDHLGRDLRAPVETALSLLDDLDELAGRHGKGADFTAARDQLRLLLGIANDGADKLKLSDTEMNPGHPAIATAKEAGKTAAKTEDKDTPKAGKKPKADKAIIDAPITDADSDETRQQRQAELAALRAERKAKREEKRLAREEAKARKQKRKQNKQAKADAMAAKAIKAEKDAATGTQTDKPADKPAPKAAKQADVTSTKGSQPAAMAEATPKAETKPNASRPASYSDQAPTLPTPQAAKTSDQATAKTAQQAAKPAAKAPAGLSGLQGINAATISLGPIAISADVDDVPIAPVAKPAKATAPDKTASKAPQSNAVPAPAAATSSGPLNILVADDNAVGRLLMQTLLQREGHTVTLVADGHKAVDKARADKFDLLIFDHRMPGMSGVEALSALRASLGPSATAPALLVRRLDKDDKPALTGALKEAEKAGFAAILPRPVRAETLLPVIERLRQSIARSGGAVAGESIREAAE